jgi:hypothetical protein
MAYLYAMPRTHTFSIVVLGELVMHFVNQIQDIWQVLNTTTNHAQDLSPGQDGIIALKSNMYL